MIAKQTALRSQSGLYTVRAVLKGPNGQSALVQSVWFVAAKGGPLRFVTAYPGGSK